MDDIIKTMRISGAGMKTQGARLQVIAQNVANANSLPQAEGGQPYRRQVMTFKNAFNEALGMNTVRVDKVRPDRSEFGKRFDPNHPAADEDGYVLTPNVNMLIEMTDMREAQRSYEANLNVIKSSKAMLNSTIDVLR
ncbi:MAG: flagellar basal body rod protein FlgC [Rhodospirillales bacterium]|nr:flagellar basal body rod protein FlgC [Pseudomonadota bacterium]